jgi:hypothetical protein
MDAYAEQSAASSVDVVWPTAVATSAQLPTRIAVVRKIAVKRRRVRDIWGKYMPSGSGDRADLFAAEVVVGQAEEDGGDFMMTLH